MAKIKKGELILILVLIGIALTVIIYGLELRPRSRQFPHLVAIFILVLLVWELGALIVKSIKANGLLETEKKGDSNKLPENQIIWRQGVMVFSLIGYLLVLRLLGFVAATFLFMISIIWFFGIKRPIVVIVFSGVFVGALYFIFHQLLYVPLPRGIFF